jgi:GTPase SAR1 family protein
MHALLEAMAKLNISLGGGDAAEAAAQAVRNEPEDAKSLRPAIGSAVNLLWEDAGVQKCYAERSKYWLLDAAPYYFKHASRFAEPEYTPTEEDAIMARVRTTGILVSEFQDPPFKYSVVDVGGQRSERRKWIHCFDNASAIIFVVSLRGYHQVMFEDQHTLRMHEALKILEDITSNPLLMPIPLFIFFNKKDLFEKDIKDISLRVGFPEYTGDDGDMLGALKFIQNKFQAIVSKNSPSRAVHMQVVCSAVRMEIKAAFTDVKLAIVKHYKMEATNGSRK